MITDNMSSLDYLKEFHPKRVIDNDFKFKFYIGNVNPFSIDASDRDIINHNSKYSDLNDYELLEYIHATYDDNKKYVIITNSIYFLKFCYKGEIFLKHNNKMYDFEEYESYDNYLNIFEGKIV